MPVALTFTETQSTLQRCHLYWWSTVDKRQNPSMINGNLVLYTYLIILQCAIFTAIRKNMFILVFRMVFITCESVSTRTRSVFIFRYRGFGFRAIWRGSCCLMLFNKQVQVGYISWCVSYDDLLSFESNIRTVFFFFVKNV